MVFPPINADEIVIWTEVVLHRLEMKCLTKKVYVLSVLKILAWTLCSPPMVLRNFLHPQHRSLVLSTWLMEPSAPGTSQSRNKCSKKWEPRQKMLRFSGSAVWRVLWQFWVNAWKWLRKRRYVSFWKPSVSAFTSIIAIFRYFSAIIFNVISCTGFA